MTVAELFAKLGLKIDGKSFSAADKALGAVKGALAGIAAYASVKLGWGVVKEVSDAADHLDELAQKTGVPIETLQQLGYAAGFSGIGIDQLGGALGKLAKTMDDAKRGLKEQADAFRVAGVKITDSSGKLRAVDDVFGDFADKIASMPDGAAKTALAIRVLGRSGASMIPVLNEGREGLAKLREEFRQSGAQIDGETAEAFANFNDDVDRLGVAWKGLKIQIVSALLPSLKSLLAKLVAWVKASRALIIEKVTGAVRTLGSALSMMYRALAPVVRVMYDFIDASIQALDHLGVLKYALIAAAGAIAVSWLGAAFPFALIGAAIGATALLVEDLYTWIKGGDSVLKDAFNEGLAALYDKFRGFFDWFEERAIDLHLIEGKRLVGGKSAFDVERRVMQGEIARGRALPVRRQSPSFISGKIASLRNEEFEIGATAKRQQFIQGLSRDGGSSLSRRDRLERNKQWLAASGIAPAVTPFLGPGNVLSSMANLAGARGPTVTIGGITIEAGAADAKEIAMKIRDELNAQLRAADATVGGKAIP